jgi:UDP-N-acetylmuramate--alanine ligase
MRFDCVRVNGSVSRLPVTLNLPGHAQRAQCAGGDCRGDRSRRADAAIVKALAEFKGVGRRFQRYGEVPGRAAGSFTLVDDYGHHPVEMRATIAAARGAFPGRRLLLAFQPHRYTRTRATASRISSGAEHGRCAGARRSLCRRRSADRRRRRPRAGARLRVAGKVEPVFVENIADMPQAILDVARDGDVVITMGAGSIGGVPGKLG